MVDGPINPPPGDPMHLGVNPLIDGNGQGGGMGGGAVAGGAGGHAATMPSGAPQRTASAPPIFPDAEQTEADFWATHGRRPTELELEALAALPMLQQQLGRPPLKVEMLQWLMSRDETPRRGQSMQVIQDAPDPAAGAAAGPAMVDTLGAA